MKKENGISEELTSMGSALAGYSRRMPYSVPDGFFESYAGYVYEIIKESDKPETVPAWGKTMPYSIPNGYFEALADDISNAIAVSDLPKGTPLSVPDGYFEALPAQILQAAKANDPVVKKETKIIPLKRRRNISSPIRWAAAAVLIMCIGLGSFEAFYHKQEPNPERMLTSVTNNDIEDYLQHTYRLDVDHIVTNNNIANLQVDNKDIVEYLNETGWDQPD